MSQPVRNVNTAWRKVAVLLVDSPFAADSETGLAIVLKKSDRVFADGWLVKITWVSPVPGVGIKWKFNTNSIVPLQHYEYFESLGGKFEDNQCSFELPPIEDFVFESRLFYIDPL